MNTVDSERIEHTLVRLGHQVTPDDPDIVIINTCTVTNRADKKSQSRAKSALKRDKKVIVTGCSVRTAADEWRKKYPDCELCPTSDDVLACIRDIQRETPHEKIYAPRGILATGRNRTRTYIEIQTGCDTYCSYCIIPFARGRSHSRPIKDILQEIHDAESQGIHEVVLTGINLAAWGAPNTRSSHETRFAELLQMILKATTIPRIRISSVGPEYMNDAFFEIYADPRICDHLHISVQSCSDKVLQMMNRGHGVAEILNTVGRAQTVRPDTMFTADVIVGFPGETDEFFEESKDVLESIGFLHLHVFPFSVRKGTRAEKMNDQVLMATKKERAKQLRVLDQKLKEKCIAEQIGKTHQVLWEKNGQGLTTNFIRIKGENPKENTLESVVITPDNVV